MQTTNMHISQLLYQHDCLIIPQLGAFVASRVPATIDRKRGVMFPPRKEIVFNKNLQHNDGVLVAYVSSQCGVSLDEANNMVSDYVATLQNQLSQVGSAHIEGIGTLKKIGSNVMLLQDKSANFLTDSYGFAQQAISVSTSGTSIPTIILHNTRRVAASIAVLTGLLMISPETRDVSIDKTYSQANVVAGLFSMSAEQPTQDATEQIAVEEAPVVEAEETAIVEPTDRYYIIVGSFPTEREADSYIATMKSQGIDGLEKLKSGKRTRVSAGQFADHDTAVRNNRTFRSIAGFENAWVLKERK